MLSRFRNRKASGFTLIELMIVVAIIGILAAVAIPAFIKYIRKSKTVEATESLDKIKIGAREYFVTDHWTTGGSLAQKQFPSTSPVPSSGPCCDKCLDPSSVWDAAQWGALKFALVEPHYYQFTFTPTGTSNASTYIARAIGDLDCDGTNSTYEIRGSIDTDGEVNTVGPIITNEIE